jgi:uncharacterized protein (DUF302 family)
MTLPDVSYGMVQELPGLDYDEAVSLTTELLAGEGFGVLTTIDVKATLKKKLDAEFRRYVILGACNPQFAHQALSSEPLIGLLLPCNVVVMERDEGGSVVAAFKPTAAFQVVDNDAVQPIAEQVEASLRKVLTQLSERA